jgi:hypothetical protein
VKRSQVPMLLAAGATILLATITGLVALETILLATGQAPITWYTECAIGAFPLWTYLVVGIVCSGIGGLLAHFFWSHAGPSKRAGR